ncbi:MAG TPA: DUF4159 domain-containing protein [Gammaproteobacteria bacterium]
MKPKTWIKPLGAVAAVVGVVLAAEAIAPVDWPAAEVTFMRLEYSDYGGRYRGGSWLVDYPDAEFHFREGVSRLTRLDLGDAGTVDLRQDTDKLFDYPWLYAVEVGYWYLDETEAARLREYLLRGGFLMVDDFHGTLQWQRFAESMHRVFPDRPIVDITESDEVMHVLYDVDERIQIPGIAALFAGRTFEYDGVKPEWKGIYDDEGRLMVAINHNMDLGDAWEHADDPFYPEPMTALAYRFAVNYVIYAMTH